MWAGSTLPPCKVISTYAPCAADRSAPRSGGWGICVFEEVFNTSRYSHKWTRGSDFADAYHVELHGNILIAEGLMRQLYPYDTEKHATLAQRARSLRRDVSIMQTPASGGTVTRGVLKIPWGGARIKAAPPSET